MKALSNLGTLLLVCIFAFALAASTAFAQQGRGMSVRAITQITMTPENSHVVVGWGCFPNDAEMIGSVADCGNGVCNGNQNFCAVSERVTLGSGALVVTDFVISPENQHRPGGIACPAGYEQIGSVADCGNGNCYGNQNVCVKREPMDGRRNSVPLADITMTPESTHTPGGTGCPRGFRNVGSNADCGGGNCYGNQVYCVR